MPVPVTIDDLVDTISGNYPLGSETVFPNLDNYLRAHAAFIAQLRDLVRAAKPVLGITMWWGGARALIPANHVPQDGQLLNRTSYPELWALVSGGGFPLIADNTWLGNPSRRGSYSTGNGIATFRMPDLNGKQANSIGALTLRGDGAFSAGAGGVQDSQNLSHTHAGTAGSSGSHTHTGITSSAGAHSHKLSLPSDGQATLAAGTIGIFWPRNNKDWTTGSSGAHTHTVSMSSSGSHTHSVSVNSSGGNEARMKSATGVWIIRVK